MSDPKNYLHDFEWFESLENLLLNNPHDYTPHPAIRHGARLLREYLELISSKNKAIKADVENGKMMGLLLVEKLDKSLGLLMGFSGQIAGHSKLEGFVPPIYDIKATQSYFALNEQFITNINKEIQSLEASMDLKRAKDFLDEIKSKNLAEIKILKTVYAEKKAQRKRRRELGECESELNLESQREGGELRRQEAHLRAEIKEAENNLNIFIQKIEALKIERANKSNELQRKLFDSYQLLNGLGEWRSMYDIFFERYKRLPPAAAGECAAPKLFHFALQNKLRPLAMGEFWMGKSPKGEIRREGEFYGACRGKCEPILNFVLQGIDHAKVSKQKIFSELQIIFEDEDLIVFDKPSGMLSVRGRMEQESVEEWLSTKYKDAKLVHRLDQDTSGILLAAKNLDAFRDLQKQFALRELEKKYIALLDGNYIARKLPKDACLSKKNQLEGEIDLPISADFINRPRQKIDYENGKPALTLFKIIACEEQTTRIEFTPHTGRTHQLRLHAAHPDGLDLPILGDRLYGDESSAERLMLHAANLTLRHPSTKELLHFESKSPF